MVSLTTDPVIADAITLRERLERCAKEFRIHGQMSRTDAGKTMAEFDAKSCEAAAEMLEKLGTEVTRLHPTFRPRTYGSL